MGIFLAKDIDRAVLQEFRDANIIPEDVDVIYRKYKDFQRKRIKSSIFGTKLDLKAFATLLNGAETNNVQKYIALFQRWNIRHNTKYRHSSISGNDILNSERLLHTLRSSRQTRKHSKNNFNPTETVDALEFFVAWTLIAQVRRKNNFGDGDSDDIENLDTPTDYSSTTTAQKVNILLKYFESGSSVDLVSMTTVHKCVDYIINALMKLHNLKNCKEQLYEEAQKLILHHNFNDTKLTLATSKYSQLKFARGNIGIWAATNPVIVKIVNSDLLVGIHNNSQLNEILLQSNDVRWLLNLYHGEENTRKILRKMKVTADHFDPMIDHFDYIRLANGERVGLDERDAHDANGAKRVMFDLHFNPFLTLKNNTQDSKLVDIQKKLGNNQTLSIKDSINMITGRQSNIDLRSVLDLDDPISEGKLQHGFTKPYNVHDPLIGSISTAYTVSLDTDSSTFSADHDRNNALTDNLNSSMSTMNANTVDFSEDGTAAYSHRSSNTEKNKLAKSQSDMSLLKKLRRPSDLEAAANENDNFQLRKHKFSRQRKRHAKIPNTVTGSRTTQLSKSRTSADLAGLLDSKSNVVGNSSKNDGGVRQETSIIQHYDGTMPFDAPAVSLVELLANFNKHKKLAMKVQSEIRSPEMVTPDNVQSIIRAFKSLSSGKEKIAKDHFVNAFKAIDSSLNEENDTRISEKAHWAERIRNQKIRVTLTRIFEKCDDDHTDFVDINEFLIHQFDNANQEEVDRAIAYTKSPPSVRAWAARYLKILFEKLSRTYHSNRKIYSRSKKHYLQTDESKMVIHENEPLHEQDQNQQTSNARATGTQFHLPLPEVTKQNKNSAINDSSVGQNLNNMRPLSSRPVDKNYKEFGKQKTHAPNASGNSSHTLAATADTRRENLTGTFDGSRSEFFSVSNTVHASHYLQNRGTKRTVLGHNAGYHPQITNEMSNFTTTPRTRTRTIDSVARMSDNVTGILSGRSSRKHDDSISLSMTNVSDNNMNKQQRQSKFNKKKNKKRFKPKQPRVAMNELFALCMHCEELRQFVLRWTRITRSRFRKMVTFEEAMDIIFQKCEGYNRDISKLTRDSNIIPAQSTLTQLALNSDNINLRVFGANLLQFNNSTDAFSNPQLLAVWAYGPFPSLSDSQLQDLKRLFDSIEQFSDCSISIQQLSNVYEWIIPQKFDDRILPNLFYRFDRNPNMRVRFKDFKELFGLLYSEFVREYQKRSIAQVTRKSKFLKRFTIKIAKRRASRLLLAPSDDKEQLTTPSSPTHTTTKNTARFGVKTRRSKTVATPSRDEKQTLKRQFSKTVKRIANEMSRGQTPHTSSTSDLKEHVELVHDLKDNVYKKMIDNQNNPQKLQTLRQTFGSLLQVDAKMSKNKVKYTEGNIENLSQPFNGATVRKNTTQNQLIAKVSDSIDTTNDSDFDQAILELRGAQANVASLKSTANTRDRDRAHLDWFWTHMLRKPSPDAAWESLIILATLMQDVDRRSAKQEMIMPMIDAVQALSLKSKKTARSKDEFEVTEQFGASGTHDFDGNTISTDIGSVVM